MHETIARERPRLAAWLRSRLPERADVEDVLQEAFYELVAAARLMRPIEDAGAWLFRVARNRLTDRHRRRREAEEPPGGDAPAGPAADPERALVLSRVAAAIEAATRELPPAQRRVFLAHELEGRSFRELAEESGESVNTLLSRKHEAVLALRRRLRGLYEDVFPRR